MPLGSVTTSVTVYVVDNAAQSSSMVPLDTYAVELLRKKSTAPVVPFV
jgi:hypothetical protein